MATAVISSLSIPLLENPAEARKRRREILASHRANTTTPDVSASTAISPEDSPVTKKQKADLPVLVSPSTPAKKTIEGLTQDDGGFGKGKKPQMKYDPEVPMTKEAAAVWRREQRRKRNRESAAASRQRQRDRIVELEEELEEWKAKFDEAMSKIRQLEGGSTSTEFNKDSVEEDELEDLQDKLETLVEDESGVAIDIHCPEALVEEVFRETTILISPSQSPRSVSPNTSFDFLQVQAVKVVSNVRSSNSSKDVVTKEHEQEEEESQPFKMISRPA
jgi:DNA repair exonuclease SbcCD ATPase subunit